MEKNKKRWRRISLVSSPQHNTTLLQANTQHFSQHEQSVFGRNNNHSCCCWRRQRKHLGWREQRGDLDCVWRGKHHWFGWRRQTGRGCCFRREADAFCNEEEAVGEESKRRVMKDKTQCKKRRNTQLCFECLRGSSHELERGMRSKHKTMRERRELFFVQRTHSQQTTTRSVRASQQEGWREKSLKGLF